jgi:hypothetical protein
MTCFHPHYQRAYLRQISKKGEYMKKIRQSTVEPVLGTLINFLALRRINTRGQAAAHKVMLLSAMAFNLKKLLRWNQKTDLANAQALAAPLPLLFSPIRYLFLSADKHPRKRRPTRKGLPLIGYKLCNSDWC